jgi:pyruvate phosphate dikinase (EC 2.7.9.1)
LSFGTNDLTQMTYGLSRDDAGRFMSTYVQQGVYAEDPFHTLDIEGVGELVAWVPNAGGVAGPMSCCRFAANMAVAVAPSPFAAITSSITSLVRRSGCRGAADGGTTGPKDKITKP